MIKTAAAATGPSQNRADSDDHRNTRGFEELRWQAEVGRVWRRRPLSASSTPR
jgi:hypothetical protein